MTEGVTKRINEHSESSIYPSSTHGIAVDRENVKKHSGVGHVQVTIAKHQSDLAVGQIVV